MKILSIDTASNLCTVAILEDKKCIKEIIVNDARNHSEKIMPVIEQALQETSLNLNTIDLIVCDKGPGSFTGIRIGVGTVLAFQDSLNIPCVGISSLEALAYNGNELKMSMIKLKEEPKATEFVEGEQIRLYDQAQHFIGIFVYHENERKFVVEKMFLDQEELKK